MSHVNLLSKFYPNSIKFLAPPLTSSEKLLIQIDDAPSPLKIKKETVAPKVSCTFLFQSQIQNTS